MTLRRSPFEVVPKEIAAAVRKERYWFVIGGQAVRCIAPYRPSRDVDFGVLTARDSKQLLAQLRQAGPVEVIEQSEGTVHLTFRGIDVSVFVLPELEPYASDNTLTVIAAPRGGSKRLAHGARVLLDGRRGTARAADAPALDSIESRRRASARGPAQKSEKIKTQHSIAALSYESVPFLDFSRSAIDGAFATLQQTEAPILGALCAT